MKKRILRGVGIILAAFSLMLGFSTAAQASSDGPTLCTTASHSCVWFIANGDKIYVQDGNADGHSAVGQVCAPADCSIEAGYFWNTAGSGTTYYWSMSYIPEGTTVYYRPCYGESSDHSIISCNSGWTHGTA